MINIKYANLTFRKALFTASYFISGVFIFGKQLFINYSLSSCILWAFVSLIIFAISEITVYTIKNKGLLEKTSLVLTVIFLFFSTYVLQVFFIELPQQNTYYAKQMVMPTLIVILLIVCCIGAKGHIGALEGVCGLLFFVFTAFLLALPTCFLNTKAINPISFAFDTSAIATQLKAALFLSADSIAICSLLYSSKDTNNCPKDNTKTRTGLYIGATAAMLFYIVISILYCVIFSNEVLQVMYNPHITVTKLFSLINIPEIYTFIFCAGIFVKLSVYFGASLNRINAVFKKSSKNIVWLFATITFVLSFFLKVTH